MGYEILEHTADIGLRATADSLEDLFAEATRALAEIAGVWRPPGGAEGSREQIAIEIEPGDLGALLVDWLSEVLYLHDARRSVIAGVEVDHVSEERGAHGALQMAPLTQDLDEGVQVKAVTYHQLRVEGKGHGWVADFYLDV